MYFSNTACALCAYMTESQVAVYKENKDTSQAVFAGTVLGVPAFPKCGINAPHTSVSHLAGLAPIQE